MYNGHSIISQLSQDILDLSIQDPILYLMKLYRIERDIFEKPESDWPENTLRLVPEVDQYLLVLQNMDESERAALKEVDFGEYESNNNSLGVAFSDLHCGMAVMSPVTHLVLLKEPIEQERGWYRWEEVLGQTRYKDQVFNGEFFEEMTDYALNLCAHYSGWREHITLPHYPWAM